MIIESIKEYLLDCPLLGNNKINVDYLPEEGREYSVDTTPAESVLTAYQRGSAMCQYQFNVSSRAAYSMEAITQIEGSGLFDALATWFRSQTAKKKFPNLGEGLIPIRIEAMSTGYLATAEAGYARYQIQCRIVYYRKKGY